MVTLFVRKFTQQEVDETSIERNAASGWRAHVEIRGCWPFEVFVYVGGEIVRGEFRCWE